MTYVSGMRCYPCAGMRKYIGFYNFPDAILCSSSPWPLVNLSAPFDILNLSLAEKVELLRINLDRLRWVNETVSDDFIVVNIAGYELYYMRDQQDVWETPVMVGKISTKTPVFHARLGYLEFNPTWNAPRSLVRGIIPKIKANPQYAADKGSDKLTS